MDLKSGIDKFGLNPEDIMICMMRIKQLPPGMLRWQLLFRQRMKRILFLQRI